MGLFDSAISNLSNMAINESAVELPRTAPAALVDEFKAMLDMMPTLEEDEMKFPVYAVPVRESKRLGRYLIEAEDLSRYMMTNGLSNILEAIDLIGKSNGITLNEGNTALVIDESSILEEMADLGYDIGGGNSNDGNIGTVGLLGPHTDLNKFRRFANSREFVDLVANKYGLPIVKKKYSIGLKKADDGSIVHKGNIQESADEAIQDKATEKDQSVINEKDADKAVEKLDEEVDPMQMIRDIASGKYDDQILAESYSKKNL